MTETTEQFEGWVILELMGHRRLAGYLREQEVAGASFLRLDVPRPAVDPGDATEPEWERSQFYSAQAVYAIHPVDEGTARLCARSWRHDPVRRWELPQLATHDEGDHDDDDASV